MGEPKQTEKYLEQAAMLANRVKKRYRHLVKRYKKQSIEIFRLYDWDIPEIRAVVDWYSGHLVIAEYVGKNSDSSWLPLMGSSVAESLGVPNERIHLKERYSGYMDGNRYERVSHTDEKIVMSERDLKFYINLNDFVDTGLFSDHRETRNMVKNMVEGKDFLNLFCYTGSFSCYAAKGGARLTVSVDRSDSAIQWTKENMELNGIEVGRDLSGSGNSGEVVADVDPGGSGSAQDAMADGSMAQDEKWKQSNILIKAHTFDFLEKAAKKGQKFDIAVVDPPSFSTSRDSRHRFDISVDYPSLLESVIAIMRHNGNSTIFFSTNHQNFELDGNRLGYSEDGSGVIKEIREITSLTIPEDYVTPRKKIHRCWKIVV